MTELRRPRVSVVVEGYNESLLLGSIAETMEALKRQDFPLDQVEVILVGSPAQAREWTRTYSDARPFCGVKAVDSPGAHYYSLKNRGAEMASGDILALTDSDARPECGWLSSLVEAITRGGDVSAGVTLFRGDGGRAPDHALMQVAASISWGFVVRTVSDARTGRLGGFLSHNVGFRAETFRRHRFRTDLGRTCAGSMLYADLVAGGARIVLEPKQRVVHNFTLWWWVSRLHRRFGYELFLLRRLDASGSRRWVASLWVLEPLLTMLWHMLLDVPQWLSVSRVLGIPRWRRLMLLPVVVGMSLLARSGEMVGMYQTLVVPDYMKRFAESN